MGEKVGEVKGARRGSFVSEEAEVDIDDNGGGDVIPSRRTLATA